MRHISRAGSYPEFGLHLSVEQPFFYGDSLFLVILDLDVVISRLNGSQFDQLFGGGLTQYGTSASFGLVKFKKYDAAMLDAQTAYT